MLATKFFEHFVYIGAAMKKMGGRDYQLWDERDGFFYDVLRLAGWDFQEVSPPFHGGLDSAVCRGGSEP